MVVVSQTNNIVVEGCHSMLFYVVANKNYMKLKTHGTYCMQARHLQSQFFVSQAGTISYDINH